MVIFQMGRRGIISRLKSGLKHLIQGIITPNEPKKPHSRTKYQHSKIGSRHSRQKDQPSPKPRQLPRSQQIKEKSPPLPPPNYMNRYFLEMVNRERRKRHFDPVEYSKKLENHARGWSKKMAGDKRLSHSGTILENACMVQVDKSEVVIARRMFNCWRGSKPHWNWMMNPEIKRAALGYWNRGNYAYGAYAFE